MPERMMNHEIIESVGIEIEFSNLDRNSNKLQHTLHQKNLMDYKLVHDASCESYKEFFADTDIPIEFEDNNKNKSLEILAPIIRRAVIGGEIVSPIRHSGKVDWINEINKLVQILEDYGEDESSERDSFHVHVNVSQSIPLYALINLLHSTLSLEAILFRLGGMGRKQRGETNNYCFCRPFLGNGPPVVQQQWRNNKVSNIPICDPEVMLQAQSKEEFFNYFGDSLNWAQRGTRYVTQRYMCVNFYPILMQGSFEFRTANKTLNPDYIIAWTNLCKAIVDKSFLSRELKDFEDIRRPLAENRDISTNELLQALSYYPKLDEDTIDVLVNIWEKSPTPQFDNLWRYTHLREPTRFMNSDYAPKSLGDTPIENANFVDIHHLEIQGRNEPVRLGEGLGPRFLLQRNQRARVRDERDIPFENNAVQIREDGTLCDMREIPLDLLELDYTVNVIRYDYEITFRKTDDHTVQFWAWDNEIDDEVSRVITDINWFNLALMFEDLNMGERLEHVRYG